MTGYKSKKVAAQDKLAQPEQEPVAKVCHDLEGHIGWNPKLTELPEEGTGLYTAAQPAQEPVVWPCLVDTADFSKKTVTIVMLCDDYTVSAGTHWLSTTPPQENT